MYWFKKTAKKGSSYSKKDTYQKPINIILNGKTSKALSFTKENETGCPPSSLLLNICTRALGHDSKVRKNWKTKKEENIVYRWEDYIYRKIKEVTITILLQFFKARLLNMTKLKNKIFNKLARFRNKMLKNMQFW